MSMQFHFGPAKNFLVRGCHGILQIIIIIIIIVSQQCRRHKFVGIVDLFPLKIPRQLSRGCQLQLINKYRTPKIYLRLRVVEK